MKIHEVNSVVEEFIMCILFYCFFYCIALFFYTDSSGICFAQDTDEPAVRFQKRLEVVISNPLTAERKNEPIVISLDSIREKAPDFNKMFYRIKHKSTWFEPLDIPTQIRMIPGKRGREEELIFQVDLAPREKKIVELWYNPDGRGLPDYPPKTRSFEKWYTGGTNIAWENEIIAYRSYNGVVDFFAKSYPHLRLHDLAPDSYHHERLWGIDPYMIGKKPGLCGVWLFIDNTPFKCYGTDYKFHNYSHIAFGDGPVSAGAMVRVNNKGEMLLEEIYSIFAGRYENLVVTFVNEKYKNNAIIAPGMQKYESEKITLNEKHGYFIFQGSPIEEYGTIFTALIWNPEDAMGFYDTDDGRFVKLKPDSNGTVSYLSIAAWNRGSAEKPTSKKQFIELVQKLALEFINPVIVEIIGNK